MFKSILAVAAAFVTLTLAATAGAGDKVTLCHAAGLEGTTQYVTITVGYPAAYGEAGHFYENGTPRAGHEQDYLGECKTEEPPPPSACPEGYEQVGEDPILCLKTVTNTEVQFVDRVVYVDRVVEVPVERVVEVPVERVVEKVVEVPVVKTVEVPVRTVVVKWNTKTKRVVKTRVLVKWKTRVVVKKVPVVGVCRIPGGTAAVQGNG